MRQTTTLALAVTILSSSLALAGCGDDASNDGSGASGGGGGATSGGGSPGTGAGGTAGSGGTAGAGGMGSACPDILITNGQPATCQDPGPLVQPHENTTECPADSSVFWPAKLYEVPVAVGDCVHMRADNAGSASGADLFGAIIDPGGTSLLFDEETPCSVSNPEGYACPEGGVTIEASGLAYVVVGSWEGLGCPATTDTPFQLSVSINGVDVDLSGGEVCAGDLLEIIP